MPICKLCGEARKLIKAHIIPRAFWPVGHNAKNTAKLITNTPGIYPKRSPQGVYDAGILCADCDNQLGAIDQHAAESLLNSNTVSSILDGAKIIGSTYEGADPDIVHKFVASIAWRASHSTHPFFENVALGRYETVIREYLRGCEQRRTGIEIMMAEFNPGNVPFLDPHSTRFDGVRFWLIYANRFIFYLKTDRRQIPKGLRALSISSDQAVRSVFRDWDGSNERRLMSKIVSARPNLFNRVE